MAMTYTPATPASAGYAEVAGTQDARARMSLIDDFPNRATATNAIGQLGWTLTSATASLLQGGALHPGVIRLSATATASTTGRITLASLNLSEVASMTAVLRMPSTVVSMAAKFGIFVSAGMISDGSQGLYFMANTSAGTSAWVATSRNAASIEKTTLTTSFVTAAWYQLTLVQSGLTVEFLVNGLLSATHTGGMVSAQPALPALAVETYEDVGKEIDVDLFMLLTSGYGARYT